MAVTYTLRVFFLQVSNELLRSYFESRDELRDFDWDGFSLSASDPLYDAWSALPERSRNETDSELRAVAELGTRERLPILIEQARLQGIDLAAELDPRAGPWQQSFWTFLKYRRVFDAGRQVHRVDHLHGRYWRTRAGLPRTPPETTPAIRDALEDSLAAYFYGKDRLPEDQCAVHFLRRGDKVCYVGYPQDAAESVLGYEAGRLRAKGQRFVREVVFAYDPVAGTLDTHARGDQRRHDELQEIFSRVVLGQELPPDASSPQPYRPNVLKSRDFRFRIDSEDHVREMRVKALRLDVIGHRGSTLDFDAGPLRYGNNVYDLVEPSLRGHNMPLANVNVHVATIQMVFAWPSGPRTLTFDVRPDSCGLRDAPEHLVARRCLRRSEIACA